MATWSNDLAANGFLSFQQSLEVLAAPAEEQCRLMGDLNVAWELADDVKAGAFPDISSQFDQVQARAFEAIVLRLNDMPAVVLNVGSGRQASLAAMSHPYWQELRQMAARLLGELAPLTTECREFLGMSPLGSNPSFQRTAARPLN